MPDHAAFCPVCGRPMQTTASAQGSVGIFPVKITGALAYVTIIPAILFLLLEPYKKNPFVRFHSLQCLFLWLACLLIGVALKFAAPILFIIPVLGHLLAWLISMVLALAVFVMWLVLVIKALQGEMFKLPMLGDFAERHAYRI
jgi:uncharacterized membrane protein